MCGKNVGISPHVSNIYVILLVGMNPKLKKVGKVALIIITPTVLLIILFVIWFIWKKASNKKELGDKFESNYGGPNSPDTCPVCGDKMVVSCKCGGPIKHSLDDLKRGHGMTCKNGHRWSYMTADGNPIIMKEKVSVPIPLRSLFPDHSVPQ